MHQEKEDFELMDDNVLPVTVFQAMQTQWRHAGDRAHRTGLDYGPLPFVMRSCRVPPAQRTQVFLDVQIMEREALKVYSERAERDQ